MSATRIDAPAGVPFIEITREFDGLAISSSVPIPTRTCWCSGWVPSTR